MGVIVIRGDARHLPLPDASVDLIVTSPPYFGLRSYTDGGQHYDGQIGSEATPAEWVAALLDCTREWMRVLKPSGSIFCNLGDKYSDRGHGPNRGEGTRRGPQATLLPQTRGPAEKSLLGLPWRYAIACTDQLGLILRAEIIWAKPNGLPESVTDRVRRAHEQVFHLVRQPRYYAAVDEIREPHTGGTHARRKDGHMSPKEQATVDAGHRRGYFPEHLENPLGKLPGSVWDIPSQPLSVPAELGVDHFAAFPMELPRRIIQGWSPPGICVACGQGRRPVSTAHYIEQDRLPDHRAEGTGEWLMSTRAFGRATRQTTITGYACGCDTVWPVNAVQPSTRPAVVLDPFGGTGTTALLAHVNGRTGITVDMSADYSRLAAWRTSDPGERARAMQVPKPPVVPAAQGSLFDLEATP